MIAEKIAEEVKASGSRVTCKRGHYIGTIFTGMSEFWCKVCRRGYLIRASER